MTDACRNCDRDVVPGAHKALSGEWATLWTDWLGDWICPVTGDEHHPA